MYLTLNMIIVLSSYAVLISKSWHIFLDTMSLSGCHLNKLKIVNKYPCSSHHMCGNTISKHKPMFNLLDLDLNK